MTIRKLCAASGCDDLAVPGAALCEEHEAERIERNRARRAKVKTAEEIRRRAKLYASPAWKTARAAFLEVHPLCADCAGLGLVTPATEVDHIARHEGDRARFWDRSNWQALCKSCHSRKTAREVLGRN
ncbi:HNH endonuclease signature motif containing protein [Rhodovulum visakhapatnamense]|uniref:Putative HNH nuclease YajD n=1 Tax=Rhodovulum visakhapatnamense TaxID=364297 RepID=A0A4R8FX03_9RHOB|nr:HNH endonuclease signature motif containing protein [Rhodovulum visakhapatnamense]TDX31156.1 5-methylcytosine-specific restriction protein A [Rhodovulum visakhapatnamense]